MKRIILFVVVLIALSLAAPASAGFSDGGGGDNPEDICDTLYKPRPKWCP